MRSGRRRPRPRRGRCAAAGSSGEGSHAGPARTGAAQSLATRDVAVKAFLEKRPCAGSLVGPEPKPQLPRGRGVREVPGAVARAPLAREPGVGAEERGDEDVRDTAVGRARRGRVEGASTHGSDQVAVELALLPGEDGWAGRPPLLAGARAVSGTGDEDAAVEAPEAEAAVGVSLDLVRPLLAVDGPHVAAGAVVVVGDDERAEGGGVRRAACRETGSGEHQASGEDEKERSAAHVPQPCRRRFTSRLAAWHARELEVAAQGLLALDRLEQRLEVALAEGGRAVPLDHLEEDGRPVLRRLGEDLEQVPVLVPVGQDLQPPQVEVVLRDLADPVLDLLVVRIGRVEEEDAALLQRLDGADDVLALHRDVLHAGRVVELEVLLDLALLLSLRGLVDRELDLAAPVRHHLRHQRRVFGLNLVVAEVDDVGHPEDALVELDPVIHPAELDVPDDVVERLQADPGRGAAVLRRRAVAGEVRARVLAPVDEGVDDVAVRPDRGQLDPPEVVLDPVRLGDPAGAPLDGLSVRLGRARHLQPDVLGGVAVAAGVLRDLAVVPQAAGHDQPDVALLEHVRGAVAHAGLWPPVRGDREPERVLVEVGRLLRVPDPELDMIPPLQRHEVVRAHEPDLTPAGCGEASSPTGTSSNPWRSGTSRTHSSEIRKTSAQSPAASRNAGCSALASASRPAGGRRWITVPSPRTLAGSCWLTITPINATPSVAPIERENWLKAVAEPICARATEFWIERTKICIIIPSPIPAMTMSRAASPFVALTPIRQSSSSPTPSRTGPINVFGR